MNVRQKAIGIAIASGMLLVSAQQERKADPPAPSPKWRFVQVSPEELRERFRKGKATLTHSGSTSPSTNAPLRLPDFARPQVDGGVYSSRDIKDRATLIAVWAHWCGACLAELPVIQRLFEAAQGDSRVAVITVNIDEPEDAAAVKAYLKRKGYTFPVLLGGGAFVRSVQPKLVLPATWIVDPTGVLVESETGMRPLPETEWMQQKLGRLRSLAPVAR